VEDAKTRKDVFSAYLGSLFLGRLHEDQGRPDEAAKVYEQASARLPEAQAAYLSLGRLQIASGDRQGWATVRRALAPTSPPSGRPTDPWYAYHPEQTPWDHDRRLLELRAMVRQER
jgi:hypothetical protein